MTTKTNIADIPSEIFLSYILPHLPLRDLLSLSCCSKAFAQISSVDSFWQHKLKTDFQITPSHISRRRCICKEVYRRVLSPQWYIWGSISSEIMERVGISSHQRVYADGIAFPLRLGVRTDRIVQLTAGGWSLTALDHGGSLYFWGTLDPFRTTPFSMRRVAKRFHRLDSGASTIVPHPTRLDLPVKFIQVSSGISFIVGLDSSRQVWVFGSWMKPYQIVSPLLDGSTPDARAAEVEAGDTFISIRTESGVTYLLWPFRGKAWIQMRDHFDVAPNVVDEVAPCEPWEARVTLIRLPPLPALPCPEDITQDEFGLNLRLATVAAGNNFLVGLTNFGQIVKMDVQLGALEGFDWTSGQDVGIDALNAALEDGRVRWEYLPNFSEPARVVAALRREGLTQPQNFTVSRITARSDAFCTYSKKGHPSILMGDRSTATDSAPFFKPLHGTRVASVVLGTSHHCLMTIDGKLLTWGRYNSGALGLGDPRDLLSGVPGGYSNEQARERARKGEVIDPPEVIDPSPVRFDWGGGEKRKLVLKAAVGETHSAALVVDLESDEAPVEPAASLGWLASVRQKFSELLAEM